MDNDIFKKVIKWVAITALPIICQYLSQTQRFYDFLIEEGIIDSAVSIDKIKDFFLLASIILTLLLLMVNLINADIQKEKFQKRQRNFNMYMKEVMTSQLRKIFGNNALSFNIRIFLPDHYTCWRIKRHFSDKATLRFTCKSIESLAQEGLKNDLRFEVYPNPQGLVGQCYNTKQAQYDDCLKETNDSELYKLSTEQLEKTNDLSFSLVYPIFNSESGNDRVIAIVAIDTDSEVNVDTERVGELRDYVSVFSQYLYKLNPEAFK